MNSDYIPAETFCCVCGCLIKDQQIADNIQGTIVHRNNPNIVSIDPFDGYLCVEHSAAIAHNIAGGLPAARRKQRELQKQDRL